MKESSMVRHLQLLIPVHFLITTLCAAMELPSIINPRQALFLTDDRVIISHQEGCSIITLSDKKTTKLSDEKFPHIALHQNKKKVAISSPNLVKIYALETEELIKTIKEPLINTLIAATILSPLDDTFYISYKHIPTITKHTYSQDKFIIIGSEKYQRNAPTIAFHPTQRIICCADNPGDLSTYNEETLEKKRLKATIDLYPFCEYSPNGLCIAAGDRHFIYILNPCKKTKISNYSTAHEKFALIKENKEDRFLAMTFRPHSTVLATLVKQKTKQCLIIAYWNIATRKPIITTHIASCNYKYNEYIPAYKHTPAYLSFSPHTNNLLITLKNNCYLIPVPLEAIYQANMEKKCTFAYWCLQNCHIDQHTALLQDILILLIYALRETYKR